MIVVGDSHLARINKSFKTSEERNFVIFKCFQGANTTQLNYYVVPTLMHEKSESIFYIGSSDITKTNYDNVNAEDLAQRIVQHWGKM